MSNADATAPVLKGSPVATIFSRGAENLRKPRAARIGIAASSSHGSQSTALP
jgi:hypothetical protein